MIVNGMTVVFTEDDIRGILLEAKCNRIAYGSDREWLLYNPRLSELAHILKQALKEKEND